MKSISFKKSQYSRVDSLIVNTSIFNEDKGESVFRGKTYPFILKNNINNLYSPYTQCILDYFRENKIAWWNGRLTNHTLSSQVACLNHLYLLKRQDCSVVNHSKYQL